MPGFFIEAERTVEKCVEFSTDALTVQTDDFGASEVRRRTR